MRSFVILAHEHEQYKGAHENSLKTRYQTLYAKLKKEYASRVIEAKNCIVRVKLSFPLTSVKWHGTL